MGLHYIRAEKHIISDYIVESGETQLVPGIFA